MAIVYSYEQATQPALGDLLLGTDVSASGKPTKSFSIQSIVDLVETGVPGGGTVTSIDTTATTFINLLGGRITTTGSLSASLSATGTPSATTYLRGDNTWSTIPSSTNTTYSIDTAQNGTSVNLRLNASDGSKTIVSFVPGCSTVLTSGANGSITIGSSCESSGTVTSVNAGIGLKVQSGNISIDPVIAMDYVGSNNYIVRSQAQTAPAPIDYIPFNNVSTGSVKTTTLSEIPITALEAVKTYVDAGDVGDIRNDTDTFVTTASVNNVVSLTSAEYTALASKDVNTLYLIVGAATSYTNTLNVDTSNITGTEYTINPSFDVTGSTRQGIPGATYSFDTRITANSGFEFNPPLNIYNAIGTFGSADATVNTTTNVTTVQAIAVPQCRATLSLSIAPCLGTLGTQYTLSGDTNGSFRENDCPLTVPSAGVLPFSTTVNVLAGYESDPSNPVTVTNWTGTISGDQTVETVITGCIRAVSIQPDDVTITPNLINAYDLNGNQSQVNLSVTPGQLTGEPGQTYTFTDTSTVNNGFEIINPNVIGLTGTYPNTSGTVDIRYTGTVSSVNNTIIVNDTPVNNIAGPTAGYTITYSPSNLQITGTTPSLTYAFAHSVALNTGYQWVGGVVPTVTPAQGTLTVAGTYPVESTIGQPGQSTVELSPTNPVATLDVTYNITQDGVLNPSNPVWSPAGNLDGTQESGASPFLYNFDTYANGTPTITIPATYRFDVAASTSPSPITPAQGITTDTTVPVTVSATISEIPVLYYTLFKCSTQAGGYSSTQSTASFNPPLQTNDRVYNLSDPSDFYIVTGESTNQAVTVSIGTTGETLCSPNRYYYIINNCANPAQLLYGYSDQPTLGAGDTFSYQGSCYTYNDVDPNETGTIDLDVLSTCTCGCEEGTINFIVTNNVTGGANATLAQGTTSVTGCVGDPYTFANSITANSGYQLSNIQWNPSATIVTSFISGTRNISQVVTGNATAIPDVVTVTLAFSNNVTNNQFTTTSLTPGTTITGNPGDSYQFVHTITTDPGYEFTSGPTWTDSVSNNGTGTINGTIPNSDTTITQSVSGEVTAIAVPQYYALQKCATGGSGFTTNLNTDQLTLSTGDIVVDTAPNPDEYYTVLADRPTVQGSTFVSLTGLQSCPTPLYYYESVQCSGTGTARVSSEDPNLTSADSYTYNSVCYEIVGSDPTQNPSYDITGLVDGCCTATLTSFTTTSISQSSGADACAQPKTQTRSHDGAGALPTTGDTVYLGSTIGSGNVGAGFWGLLNNTYYQTNSSGVVTSVQACPVVDGTVNLTVTNQVANSSYTVNPASQTITDAVGDSYTFTTTVVPNSGYELVPGTIQYNGLPNGIQSGTISAGTTEITQTITGQTRLLEYYTLTKCDPNGGPGFVSFVDIYDSINGTVANPPLSNGDTVYDAGNDYYYTVTGTTATQGSTGLSSYTGGTGCPAPLYYYNVVQCFGTGTDKVSSEVANLTSDYSYTYNSVCYKIVDTDLTQTPSYDITSLPSGCCTATVNVNFTNSVVGKANTTTTIADGGTASATGLVGTSYSITNSISANSGYGFTSGPTWSTGGTGTVTGTFTSGTTNIAQDVTGTVTASTTVYTQQITAQEDGGFGTPSTTAAAAKTQLCFQFLSFSAYSEDANITDAVQLNARWFADSQGTNPFSGAFKWYGVGTPNDLGAVYVIRLSDAGVVTEVTTAC